jgi:hypothetical protein
MFHVPLKNFSLLCKILAYDRRSGLLSREASLSCHTCCDTKPRFFRLHPKGRLIQSPLTTRKGVWRIYSNPEPHVYHIPCLQSFYIPCQWGIQPGTCWGPILNASSSPSLHCTVRQKTSRSRIGLWAEGTLSCHTCCDMGPRFFRFHLKECPIQSPLTTCKGMRRIYSNPDLHESHIQCACTVCSSNYSS